MNPELPTALQRLAFRVVLLALAAGGHAGCGKKSAADHDEARNVLQAIDHSQTEAAREGPKPPIPGVALDGLSDEQRQRFDDLADSLASPCGEAHSLRTSAVQQPGCKRARFAAGFVALLLARDLENEEVRELYGKRYLENLQVHKFTVGAEVPHKGAVDAPVVVVEFYDYGCPHCAELNPVLETLAAEYPSDVVLYYKQYPLSLRRPSLDAAKAALAAHRQGKFAPMHALLFARQPDFSPEDLRQYARRAGLDLARFERDTKAVEELVLRDHEEGERAGVNATPTVFVNGRLYEQPAEPELLKSWIEEERAVNR